MSDRPRVAEYPAEPLHGTYAINTRPLGDLTGHRGVEASRRHKAAAGAGAVLLHLLFLGAFFATACGTVAPGAVEAWGDGEAVEVMLSGLEGGGSPRGERGAAPSSQQAQLDQMVQSLRLANSNLFTTEVEAPRPRGDLASLFDGQGQSAAEGRRGLGAGQAGIRDEGGRAESTRQASQTGGGGEQAGAAGVMWSHIKPCWTRLPGSSTVAVTLELSLTAGGRLAKPPKILRPTTGRPDELRLLSEARALQAIATCLPYAETAGVAITYTVIFPSNGDRGY